MWTMSTTTAQASSRGPAADEAVAWPRWVPAVWVAFVSGALLLLDVLALPVWSAVVGVAAVVLTAVSAVRFGAGPWVGGRVDRADLLTVVALYAAVVGLFRLAFVGFTQANVVGLFLAFAAGLLVGTAGPIAYTTWVRDRPLSTLGLGLHRLPATIALAVLFAAVQFAVTLWGYRLPAPVDWVPLLVMSVVVGLFEAVFFRGFVQGRLEASFGIVAGVAGGAVLYAGYHVGYGMGVGELWFLLGLGVVYTVAYRLVGNIVVLWPLLTPLGAFFNNLQAGDIDLPWAAIAGFGDVLMVVGVVWWVAWRYQRRHQPQPASGDAAPVGPADVRRHRHA